MAPWARIRLTKRLYGPKDGMERAIVLQKDPGGSQQRWHHGHASAFLSAVAFRVRGGLARIAAEIAQQVSIRFAKHTVLQPRRKARQRKRVCRKDTRRAIVLLKGARGSQQKSQQWGWIAPGACIRFAERLYGPRGTHESVIIFLKARMDRIAPWACIRLAERLYGHGGTHGSANRLPEAR